MKKTDKMLKGVFATITSVGLAVAMSGCASNAAQDDSSDDISDDTVYTNTTSGNSQPISVPPVPTDQQCTDWEWDDESGVWMCDDDSGYHGHYFYGGHYYPTYTALNASSGYQSYRNSSSYAGKNTVNLQKNNTANQTTTTNKNTTTNSTNTTKNQSISTGEKGLGSGTKSSNGG